MPCYLFTFHAYGSWMPDRPRGFVQKDRGIQPTNPRLASAYARAARHPPVVFDAATQVAVINRLVELSSEETFRLHAAVATPTHVHVLVSWSDARDWSVLRGRLRNLVSLALSRRAGAVGRPWFSQGSSRRRVSDQSHFNHLTTSYLPKHRGTHWYEKRSK